MIGKIKKYLSYKGFGFISLEDSEDDIFFHISNYPRTALPTVGQEVEFEIIETPKGNEARNIRIIEKTAEIFELKEEKKVEEKSVETGSDDLDTLKGVGPVYQKLIRATGIKTKAQLVKENPEELIKKINKANEIEAITKRPPTLANIEAWIKLAS